MFSFSFFYFMNLTTFKQKLATQPQNIEFSETIAVIDNLYSFTPSAFQNGELKNAANENNGSCKLFAFAKLQGFSKEETLACFGKFYTEDVLQNPDGDGHQNIRNFMKTGWEGIAFESEPLKAVDK